MAVICMTAPQQLQLNPPTPMKLLFHSEKCSYFGSGTSATMAKAASKSCCCQKSGKVLTQVRVHTCCDSYLNCCYLNNRFIDRRKSERTVNLPLFSRIRFSSLYSLNNPAACLKGNRLHSFFTSYHTLMRTYTPISRPVQRSPPDRFIVCCQRLGADVIQECVESLLELIQEQQNFRRLLSPQALMIPNTPYRSHRDSHQVSTELKRQNG